MAEFLEKIDWDGVAGLHFESKLIPGMVFPILLAWSAGRRDADNLRTLLYAPAYRNTSLTEHLSRLLAMLPDNLNAANLIGRHAS